MNPVELFIIDQAQKLQAIYGKQRGIILNKIPQIHEKLIYGIPFFYLQKRIFYLTPKINGIDLGFYEGFLLSKHSILEVKDRSQVRTIFFGGNGEIKKKF